MLDSKKLVNGYLTQKDWHVQENSNAPFSFGALNKRLGGAVSSDYWLNEVYTKDITDASNSGFFHIHDLGGLTLYCCGYSLQDVIMTGVKGVPNIPVSAPAKHFASILNQLANLTTIFQNEIMGAVAFSSFDTLLAPYIREDKLDYYQVKQNLQNYIFSVNSNSRAGAEPAFSNLTFDLNPPKDLKDKNAVIGNDLLDTKYSEYQKEMDMINRAFCELMLAGDALGKPFAYPIPTYNIHEATDWESPIMDLVFELTGKFGTPYFGNFGPKSDMDVSDIRSMCCRLRLDLRELRKKTGGLFASGDSTGSIGVVTLNLPRYTFLSKTKEDFYIILRHYMDLAKDSLEIKRAFLTDEILSRNALPAFMTYVGTLDHHFSTIGLVGMNEMCLNASWLGKDLTHEDSIQFCIEVLNYMRDTLVEYQQETKHLYNLEATPAESTCYELALKDSKAFPGIKTQGSGEDVYYTNSCRLPVDKIESIDQEATIQSRLQPLFTGGTAEHFYVGRPLSAKKAKRLIKYVIYNYNIPYITLSPLMAYCPEHGKVMVNINPDGSVSGKCPYCGKDLDFYQRITGYIRQVKFYNKGKAAEFKDRKQLD